MGVAWGGGPESAKSSEYDKINDHITIRNTCKRHNHGKRKTRDNGRRVRSVAHSLERPNTDPTFEDCGQIVWGPRERQTASRPPADKFRFDWS